MGFINCYNILRDVVRYLLRYMYVVGKIKEVYCIWPWLLEDKTKV